MGFASEPDDGADMRDSREGSPASREQSTESEQKVVTYHSRSRSQSRSQSRSSSQRKSKKKSSRSRSRSRSHHRSRKSKTYRSRSKSPRKYSRTRRSRTRSRSRSRSGSYSPAYRRRGRSHSRSPMSSRRRHTSSRDNPQPNRCLGVFGLSLYTTESQLHQIFSKYGRLERVQVIIDAKTGRSRGFCFVYYEHMEDARAAKEQCSGMEIGGRKIRVDYSITERAHTPTPGIYMGKPTYSEDRYSRRSYRYDDDYGGYRGRYRSPSPYYSRSRRSRYDRSRSRSYSPRRY